MKKIAKERTIYDNYNPWDTYPDDVLKEMALECEWVEDESEITEENLCEWRFEQIEEDWNNEKEMLSDFFEDKIVEFIGSVGLLHGTYEVKERDEF